MPRTSQWSLALALLLVFLALATLGVLAACQCLALRPDHAGQLALAAALAFLPLLPLWLGAGNLLLAPLLRLLGVLRYVSPYLVVTRGRGGNLELHGATLFDSLLLFRWSERGRPAVRKILALYVEGLLALAREVEEGHLPRSTVFSATSYIFRETIARRYGFHGERARRHMLGGLLTYPVQFLTYSFSQGRWSPPPLRRSHRAVIDGNTLAAQAPRLRKLHARLARQAAADG